MQALEDALELEIAADQARGRPQPIQIVDLEGCRLVGGAQGAVGVTPGATFEAPSAVFKTIHLTTLEPAHRTGTISSLALFKNRSGRASGEPGGR